MKHQLLPLPYDYAALEPHIDAETMRIHHDKHHQAYVDKFNAALETAPEELQNLSAEQILSRLDKVPEVNRTAIRNHGGGHANHSFFWTIMGPQAGGEPTGELAEAISSTFGDFSQFKETFSTQAKTFFGSGWTWLVKNEKGSLSIISSQNQDCPLSDHLTPLLNLDLWEHAYYLKYQNKRADYVDAWWNVINWEKVNEYFSK